METSALKLILLKLRLVGAGLIIGFGTSALAQDSSSPDPLSQWGQYGIAGLVALAAGMIIRAVWTDAKTERNRAFAFAEKMRDDAAAGSDKFATLAERSLNVIESTGESLDLIRQILTPAALPPTTKRPRGGDAS